MRDELLRHVIGPTPYWPWWLWTAVLLLVLVTAWFALVFIATLPSDRLRGRPVVGPVHARLLRRRYAARIADITADHEAGRMSAADACAAISRVLRSFLHQATGVRAQYMQIDALEGSSASAAAPVLADLGDARFTAAPPADVGQLGARAQELVRTWI
ncbi:hypothetical protein MDOR_36530 [Mycolicibacterium doricum]|uniref:DUF4381 domain-containing protein n=1 Tax=Mycolicibacterium doricum TaxID=126673 RepID=A0A1X1TNN5_9MYCO|nr:hypothetical protein [Mycolicibacterium doricum]MCV7269788.1 hypothetical protein [Mycolicibacterium doricum]ORV46078.1 hypothetical protein AWC01_00900 [Mycolicibacterium doricum]BBZ09484.1 hypothetical protein MDOR_36530 [Mycolicibacterium doricum]